GAPRRRRLELPTGLPRTPRRRATRGRPDCGARSPARAYRRRRAGRDGSVGAVPATPSAGETRYRERCLAKTGVAFRGDERLLDVGCGNGGVARLLRERVPEVVAVDVEASPSWRDGDRLTFE